MTSADGRKTLHGTFSLWPEMTYASLEGWGWMKSVPSLFAISTMRGMKERSLWRGVRYLASTSG